MKWGKGTKVIGVAGESGTGKSTVAGALALHYDGTHVDADHVGHGLLAGNAAVIAAVTVGVRILVVGAVLQSFFSIV